MPECKYQNASFYKSHVAPGVKSLLLGVVGVAIGLVGSGYLKILYAGLADAIVVEFICRSLLLFAMILYIAYDHLIYETVSVFATRLSGNHPYRTICVYLVDVFQVFILGMLVYALNIEVSSMVSSDIEKEMRIDGRFYALIYGLLTVWHGLILLWYLIVGSTEGNEDEKTASSCGIVTYLCLAIASGVFAALAWNLPSCFEGEYANVAKILFALSLAVFVGFLLFFRAPQLLKTN